MKSLLHRSLLVAVSLFIIGTVSAQFDKIGGDLTYVATTEINIANDGQSVYVVVGEGDALTGHLNKLSVRKYNTVTTDWDYIGSPKFTKKDGEKPILVFDGTTPYVLFQDMDRNGYLSVMTFNGTSWVYVGNAGFSGVASSYYDFEVVNGVVTVVFGKGNTCATSQFSSGSWKALSDVKAGAHLPLVEKNAQGEIIVAVKTNFRITEVFKLSGSSWVPHGNVLTTTKDVKHMFYAHNDGKDYIALSLDYSTAAEEKRIYQLVSGVWTQHGASIVDTDKDPEGAQLTFENNVPMFTAWKPLGTGDSEIFAWIYKNGQWVEPFSGGSVTSSLWSDDYSFTSLKGRPYVIFHNSDHNRTMVYGFSCYAPTVSSLKAEDDTLCRGGSTDLKVTGWPRGATQWSWYSGSCGGTFIDTGKSITVSPGSQSQTYYLGVSGGCYNGTFCDSVTVEVRGMNKQISVSGTDLVSQELAGDSYQWLSCDSNMKPVLGATGQTFSPGNMARYAVEITKKGCVDTSGCASLNGLSVFEGAGRHHKLKMYPNPARNKVNLELSEALSGAVSVLNLNGQLVHSVDFEKQSVVAIDLPETLESGVYFIHVRSNGTNISRKLILQRK